MSCCMAKAVWHENVSSIDVYTATSSSDYVLLFARVAKSLALPL